jgi:hypothetical protein
MINEARKTTGRVLEKVNRQCYDKDTLIKAYCEIANWRYDDLPKKVQEELQKSNVCLEGLCYGIGLTFSKFPSDSMIMRCVQFLNLIDKSLYDYGIEPCSLDMKIELYKVFNLYEAYEHDSKMFETSKNRRTQPVESKSAVDKNEPMTYDEEVTYIESLEKKTIKIQKRNVFPPAENDPVEIYRKLINTKGLTFETVWDSFQNIQCFNDVEFHETIELNRNGGYSEHISHFSDVAGRDYSTYFSSLPNKAIDFFLFQLLLEYINGVFYCYRLVTDQEEIVTYKEKLEQLKQTEYHAFNYGPYPYSFEVENIPHIQAFLTDVSGEIIFVDVCVVNGEKYKIVNTVVIEGSKILF